MRISRRLLAEGERPVLTVRTHPIRLLGPGLRALAGIGAALALGYYATPQTGTDAVDLIAAAVALLVVARFVGRFLTWRRRRVVLTDQRLLRLSGGIIRRVASVSLEQISQVELVQGIAGRLLGYGTVEVHACEEHVSLDSLRGARQLWALLAEPSARGDDAEDPYRRSRTLAPGLPFDRQDTGPLPRALV
jgi:membrane protein YdbS with pleckstrin-like domain